MEQAIIRVNGKYYALAAIRMICVNPSCHRMTDHGRFLERKRPPGGNLGASIADPIGWHRRIRERPSISSGARIVENPSRRKPPYLPRLNHQAGLLSVGVAEAGVESPGPPRMTSPDPAIARRRWEREGNDGCVLAPTFFASGIAHPPMDSSVGGWGVFGAPGVLWVLLD